VPISGKAEVTPKKRGKSLFLRSSLDLDCSFLHWPSLSKAPSLLGAKVMVLGRRRKSGTQGREDKKKKKNSRRSASEEPEGKSGRRERCIFSLYLRVAEIVGYVS
jgi:hypothetical protein